MERSYKLLMLNSHVMGYTFACLRTLVNSYPIDVILVHYRENINSPYKLPKHEHISAIYKDEQPYNFAVEKFDLVYIAGWFDDSYLKIAKEQKKRGAIVIAGCDTQWNGSLRQRFGYFYAKFNLKRFIDYFWVPGVYQYELIRHLGFSKDKILFNLYSADTDLYSSSKIVINKKYPHNIVFVGRFVSSKGIGLLVESFEEIKKEHNNDWTLTLIGNGPLKKDLTNHNIAILDFLQPEELAKIISNFGVFCLPSIYEPWGVVVHEFASAGLPLIVSNACGSSMAFVRQGYNGYVFESNNKTSLKNCLYQITSKTDDELHLMGSRSIQLAKTISPEIWASTIMSLLK